MTQPNRDAVLAALARVVDPHSGQDLVASGMVQGLTLKDGAVAFAIEVPPALGARAEPLRQAAEAAVRAIPGVVRVMAVLTAHSNTPSTPASTGSPPNLRAQAGDKPLPVSKDSGPIEGVNRIIAVGSGKGGVGKSTVAANLALAFHARGLKVGLLDADVYGPSQPRMMGNHTRPATPDGKTIEPLIVHGIKMMSMGLMVEAGQSIVWRGPMLMSAITQMLRQVRWAPLDVLVIDLPPGTGDVQITLSQRAQVDGAVIVSTPQDIALIDALKAVDMFRKTNTPVLGMIENMSVYCCPNCGHRAEIFGHGGARREAARLGLPFLGEVPLDIDLRLSGDSGTPAVIGNPQGAPAAAFRAMAEQIMAGLRR